MEKSGQERKSGGLHWRRYKNKYILHLCVCDEANMILKHACKFSHLSLDCDMDAEQQLQQYRFTNRVQISLMM